MPAERRDGQSESPGVDVGSLHPTFFKTPMMDDVHADPAANTSGR